MKKLSLEQLNRDSLEEFRNKKKQPIVIVLDNIRSAHNVGSVFRTADGFALSHIYLCGITARPPHKEITKTAIGATEAVTWSYAEDVSACVSELKDKGYQIIGIEQTDVSVMLSEYEPTDPSPMMALVLGNEVHGLTDALLPLLDQAIEIPQYGTKHSFNVSVCAGIVIWEIIRKLNLRS